MATRTSDLQIQYSLFVENTGSALSIGPQANSQPCIISFTEFTRNTASGGGNVSADGGAISAFGNRPADGARLALQLHRCSFEGNTAARFGGALATHSGVSTSARGCEFQANTDSVRASAHAAQLHAAFVRG